MSCILDIDLDYFRLFSDPIRRLDAVLEWARRPVDLIVDEHHKVLNHWDRAIEKGVIEAPTCILHVGEHHDMLSEQPPVLFGNFLYFAMRKWPDCRVHWLTKDPIDDPSMWLSEEARGLRLAIDSALGRASTPSGLCRSWCLFAPVPALLKILSLRSYWNGSTNWGTGRITREIGVPIVTESRDRAPAPWQKAIKKPPRRAVGLRALGQGISYVSG